MMNILLLFLAANASAYTLNYELSAPDIPEIRRRIEGSTGLVLSKRCNGKGYFVRRCDVGKSASCEEKTEECPFDGTIKRTATGIAVVIHDAPSKKDWNVRPQKVTPELQARITKAVLEQP